MPDEINVEGTPPKRVAKDIMEGLERGHPGGVIKQELKTHISIKIPSTGDEIKVSEMPDIGGGAAAGSHVDLSLASQQISNDVKGMFGRSTTPTRETVRSGTGPESVGDVTESGTSPGTGEVYKPFGHDDAGYVVQGDEEFDPDHERCRSCAHYDDHGNCHIVPDIDPDGYCSEFYADVGMFGHKHPWGIENNLNMFGEMFDWSMDDVENFVGEIRERLQEKVRGL